MKRPSPKLLAAWYDKAAASGFKDIEMRRNDDTNLYYEAPSTYNNREQTLDGWDHISGDKYGSYNPIRYGFTGTFAAKDMENLAAFGKPTMVWDTPIARHRRGQRHRLANISAEGAARLMRKRGHSMDKARRAAKRIMEL